MSAPPKRASRLELIGVMTLVVVALGSYFYFTSTRVSGELRVGTTTLQAERCRGFAGGVQIFLSGEDSNTITAGIRTDGSLRVTYNGEDLSCTDARLDAAEGVVTEGRSGGPVHPVISGSMNVDCIARGEPIRGSFEFARCRQD